MLLLPLVLLSLMVQLLLLLPIHVARITREEAVALRNLASAPVAEDVDFASVAPVGLTSVPSASVAADTIKDLLVLLLLRFSARHACSFYLFFTVVNIVMLQLSFFFYLSLSLLGHFLKEFNKFVVRLAIILLQQSPRSLFLLRIIIITFGATAGTAALALSTATAITAIALSCKPR